MHSGGRNDENGWRRFFTSKCGFLSAVVPVKMLEIGHFVGTVEAESHGQPFNSTPNAQKLARRDAADGVLLQLDIFDF